MRYNITKVDTTETSDEFHRLSVLKIYENTVRYSVQLSTLRFFWCTKRKCRISET